MSYRISSGRCAVLACAAGLMVPSLCLAQPQWTATVLHPGTADGFGSGNTVWRDRQGGTFDTGFQQPLQWRGTAASEVSLVKPPGADAADVVGMSDSGTVGGGFIYGDPNGYYAVFLWNVAGDSVSLITAPPGFDGVFARGMGGTQQVGVAEVSEIGLTVPALWNGTTASFINLLPAAFDSGRAAATDGAHQVGVVSTNAASLAIAALWSGTAASFVNLHPGGEWLESVATGVSQGRQCGYVVDGMTNQSHAVVWQGSAQSMIDLHPGDFVDVGDSEATGMSGAVVSGIIGLPEFVRHACVWTNLSAASFVDLHTVLGPDYGGSQAHAVWTDASGIIRVIGDAYSASGGNTDVILWTYDPCALPITIPATADALANDCDGDMRRDSCATLTGANDCNNNGQLDSCETLVFTNETFTSGPGAWSVNGSASIPAGEGFVQLTPSLGGQGGSVVRPPLTAGVTQRLRAIFDFRIDQNQFPGDGFSFSLLDAAANATSVTFGEEGLVVANAITVKFNTYQNYPAEGSNSVTVKYGGADISINAALPLQLADGVWHRAVIDLTPQGKVSVRLGTNPGDLAAVLSDVQLPNYTPRRNIIGFGGRTGAAISRHSIANVRLGVNGPNDLNGNGIPDSCECPAAGITTPPSPQTACPSGSATFTVVGSGIAPLTYQWRKGGTAINAATNSSASTSTLTIRNISASDVGSYDCIVANTGGCGAVTSPAAALSLAPRCSLADVTGTTSGATSCGDGTVDGSDFVAFINSFAIGDVNIDPLADVAGGGANGSEPDGTIDGTDFVAFINAFALGC